MQIELVGCTSSGKTTLLRGILQACRDQGIDAVSGYEYVLMKAHLNWVKGTLMRTLLLDLVSLISCFRTWRKNYEFFILTLKILFKLPSSTSFFVKLNIARNVYKKVGIYEIICRYDSDNQIVLMDEGTLNTANYLFVHVSAERPIEHFSTFKTLVTLPDVVIYLKQEEKVMIERTLIRGHKRIPDGSRELVERFVHRAVTTFDELTVDPSVRSRLVIVSNSQDIVVPPEYQHHSKQSFVLNLLQAGIDVINNDGLPKNKPILNSRLLLDNATRE